MSDDSRYLIGALREFGVRINELPGSLEVEGSGGLLEAPKNEIFVGNAGTAMRYLTALAALAAYAIERKVVPVSPNCLYAYLQAIALGLRGLRIEARAQEVMGQLAGLGGDLSRFRDDFRLLGKHLGNAVQAQAAAERRLERFRGKLTNIAGGEEEAEPVQPPLLRIT